MNKILPICLTTLAVSMPSAASFLDDIVDAVAKSAKDTATDVAVQVAADMVREMLIGYTTEQTKTDKEVAQEYEKATGSLPVNTIAASYKTEMTPGSAVRPGTKVVIKSYIDVVPGTNGKSARIEERLTIFDNEDNSVVLKTMTKEAAESSSKGGQFKGEFTFTLPEGLPQGMYPVRSTLLLNGELAGDQDHQLQLVLWIDETASNQLIASVTPLSKEMLK
jgi:hypothetical protein